MTSPVEDAGLVGRLEAAEVGSRELDAELFRHFGGPLPDEMLSLKLDLQWQGDGSALMPVGDMQVRYNPPAYSTSLDAALALAERVLPGWHWSVSRNSACIIDDAETTEVIVNTVSGSPPLALCVAIIRASQAAPTQSQEKSR